MRLAASVEIDAAIHDCTHRIAAPTFEQRNCVSNQRETLRTARLR